MIMFVVIVMMMPSRLVRRLLVSVCLSVLVSSWVNVLVRTSMIVTATLMTFLCIVGVGRSTLE